MRPEVDRMALRLQSIHTVVVPSENGCLNSLIFDLICMYPRLKVAANHHLSVLRFSPKLRYKYKHLCRYYTPNSKLISHWEAI